MRAAGLEPDLWQLDIFRSPARQHLLCAHRQGGKSTAIAAMALEAACHERHSLILLLSRTLRQSGELLRKVKRFYQATTPMPLLQSSALSIELENNSRIVSLPGTEDTIVGYSAPKLVVIDESARVPDVLFYSVRPMLAMSHGRLIALSTPWGARGWWYEAWEGIGQDTEALDAATVQALLADLGMTVSREEAEAIDTSQDEFAWHRTKVTALDNPRLNKRFLANERRTVPDLIFRSEWLCEFVQSVDSVFDYNDLERMISSDITPIWYEGNGHGDLPWLSERVDPLFAEDAP